MLHYFDEWLDHMVVLKQVRLVHLLEDWKLAITGEALLVYGYRLHCRRSTYSQHSGMWTDLRV